MQANEHTRTPVTRTEILDAIGDAFGPPPATKSQIIAAAEDTQARSELVALLRQLDDRTFHDVRDLWEYFPDVPVDV